MSPRFDRLGNFRCAGGESVRPVLRILDDAGVPVDLTGLAFALRVLSATGATLVGPIAGTVAGTEVAFALPGATTIALVGVVGARMQITQLLADGRCDWVTGSFTVSRGGSLLVGAGPIGDDLISVDRGGVIAVSARGAPGSLAAAFLTANADTPRSPIDRTREFDVEDFRKWNGTTRSDRDAFRSMIDRARDLAANSTPVYSTMRFAGRYNVGAGNLMPDGGADGCVLQGYGRRRAELLVTANDNGSAGGRGCVFNLRGTTGAELANFSITYSGALTPQDFALIADDCAEPLIERISILRGYGTLLVGRTGPVQRPTFRSITHLQLRGALGGDHVRVFWASSIEMQRLRCNTSEEMTGAFYRFVPDIRVTQTGSGGEPVVNTGIDTFKMIDCQGQNSVHFGLTSGDGLVFDWTRGNIYSGTLVGCILDHTFRRGVAFVSEPFEIDGVLQRTSCRRIIQVDTRNSADNGVSRYFSHRGHGRLSQIVEVAGLAQVATDSAIKIETLGSDSYWEAPSFQGFQIRSTSSVPDEEYVANVFDVAASIRFQNGAIGRLGENERLISKLGTVRGAEAVVTFTGSDVEDVSDPTFAFPAGRAEATRIAGNVGLVQDTDRERVALQIAAASPYRGETLPWLLATSGAPPRARKDAYDDFVAGLVDAGLWSEIALLAVLAATDEGLALRDLRVPTRAFAKSGAIAFTKDRGYAGDGATGSIDLGYLPGSDAIVAQDSFTLLWSPTANVSADNSFDVAAGSTIRVNARDADGKLAARIGTSITRIVAVPDSNATFAVARTGATATAIYADAQLLASPADASEPFPTTRLTLARNGALFSPRRVGLVMMAAGWDATKVATATGLSRALLASIGAPT